MLIIQILSAFLTPVIAILAAYIAYQQYVVNKRNSDRQYLLGIKKVNLDLYQKRFRIFKETKQILLEINKNAGIHIVEIRDFNFSVNESKFLFGDGIIQFLQELQEKAIDLTHLTKDLDNINAFPVGSMEREKKIAENRPLITWFTHEYEHVEDRFVKYLNYKNL